MTKHYTLPATKRDGTGKGVARALRREKKTPAVIYGDKKEPITIALPSKEINLEYNKGHMFTTLCDLDVEGDKHQVLARDVQLHPVTDNVMHVDFLRVTDRTQITVSVPVNFVNYEESEAAKEKGVMNVVRYAVDMVCRARYIPDAIDIDMTEFKIGDAVKMSNATLPEGATPAITDRDFTIATIAAPRVMVEEEPEDAEGEEGAEGEAAEGGDAPAAEGDALAEENKE
ncbi:MAG: 50S ribosomal protein L25/general stress protein Ctc [Alphaproteobacteria bacterium]|nr:50S ribosomal protein L25/general stress protein Ctc [Alphaproteobacteria bacterium]